MLLPISRSWKWQTTLYLKVPSLPDTLWVLLIGFASMAWSTALESLVFSLPNLVWVSRFLQPKQDFSNHLVPVLWSTSPSSCFFLFPYYYRPIWIWKPEVLKLDHVAHLSVVFNHTHTHCEAIHNVSVHHLLWYYQLQWEPFTAWSYIFMWYTYYN